MEITPGARSLYDELAQGWNTWAVHSVASHSFLPDGLEVSFSLLIPDKAGYCRDFTWPQVTRFGEHALRGEYSEIDLEYLGSRFQVQTAAEGEQLVMKITPLDASPGVFVAVEVHGIWGGIWTITQEGNTIRATGEQHSFLIDTLQPTVTPEWTPILGAHLVLQPGNTPLYVRVNAQQYTASDIDDLLQKAEHRWLTQTITSDGNLGAGLEGLRRVLLWNTIYEARNKRVIAPVSRHWCQGYGYAHYALNTYVLFGWDTFFAGLMSGLLDKRLAYAQIFSILEEITPEGFIPNDAAGGRVSRDRSEPQVGSWCVWKLYLQFGDTWFLEECFERLLRWNRWRFQQRDCNGDGLLELASTPWDMTGPGRQWAEPDMGKKQGAMWESGLDNSPMWDDAAFNEEKHCLELSYVGLNAEMVADCQCLAAMARVIGRKEEAHELDTRGAHLADLINTQLWHEEKGTYLNRDWQQVFSPCMSLTHFYPLLAGIVPPERIERIFAEHLLNPDEFWGEYVIPMTNRNDPAFLKQDYWRGRIWGPTNFLVNEGIRRAGRADISAQVAEKSLHMFVQNWHQSGFVSENYNVLTGEGSERSGSDKFYHWGALLVYLAVQEFFDAQAWDGNIKLGSTHFPPGSLRNLPFQDTKIDVSTAQGVQVREHGETRYMDNAATVTISPDELAKALS